MKRFNAWFAQQAVLKFGTMVAFYLCIAYSLIAALHPAWMDTMLYWSNAVQLAALPLLMVGSNLLGRDAERRAQEQYRMTQELVAGLHEELALLRAEGAELRGMHAELHETVKRTIGRLL